MVLIYLYTFLGINKLNNNTNNTNNTTNKTNTTNNVISYIYSFLIFLLLLFNPIYYFITNKDINYIGFNIYKINYIVHFLFLYCNFHKIIKYKYLDNSNFNIILLISQGVILCSYISNIIINYQLNIYVSENIIINVLINISEFYGIFVYMNNIILFLLIFIKLFQDIYIIQNNLEYNIETNNKKGLITFFYNIVNLKNIVTYTISDFNYILNIFSIINLFSLGLIYHIFDNLEYNWQIYFYILCSYFIVIEILALGLILLISRYREEIFSKIYDPLFVNNFIKKYDINTFNDTYEVQLDINDVNVNNITLFNILEENSTSIDWIILNITLNSKWVDFDLFGIKIHSLNSINQIIVIIALFYKIML